ncbi:MAG: hypothetical protein AAGB27_01045 [Pseudomonadota bacterium]
MSGPSALCRYLTAPRAYHARPSDVASTDDASVSFKPGDKEQFLDNLNGSRLCWVSLTFTDDVVAAAAPEIVLDDPRWQNVDGYSYWPDPANGGFLVLRSPVATTTRELRVIEGWQSATGKR